MHREPSHPSWYAHVDIPSAATAASAPPGTVRAAIVPHAAHRYSGPTAALAYAALARRFAESNATTAAKPLRLFILAPSHVEFTDKVLFSPFATYNGIRVDYSDISPNDNSHAALFDTASVAVDTREHSIDVQIPLLARALELANAGEYTLAPLIVGDLSEESLRRAAGVLAPLLRRDDCFFLVSSDFCHWGARFEYTPRDDALPVHEFIRRLDKDAITAIQTLRSADFSAYLKRTRNTICGRNPIRLLLAMIEHRSNNNSNNNSSHSSSDAIDVLGYAQSSQVTDPADSSVSYVAAVYRTED